MARVMGLDVGTKTIGVALSDPGQRFPWPLRTLSRRSVVKDAAEILAISRDQAVERAVVGLPLELDGSEARSARLARQIGEALVQGGLPVTYIDERFSSVEAERLLIAQDVSRKRRKEVIDQAAAALILQSFLDHGDWTRDGGASG
jgi:putative holliday junction resolvase